MPKKRPAHHYPAAQPQRPQPKHKDVVLVRSTSATEVVENAEEETTKQTTGPAGKTGEGRTKPASQPLKTSERSTTAGRRPETTTKPGAQLSRNLAASQRAGRPGQRASTRAGGRMPVGRQANLVSAEHYRYVLKDLRLIGILAAIMFSAIIALTFILPQILSHFVPQ